MKKILVLLTIIMLASCSTYYRNYFKYTIEKCIRISDNDFGQLEYRTEDKEKETRVKISDDFFDISISQIENGLNLYLNNKSKEEIYIDWDKSWFIDDKGQKSVLVNSFTEFFNPPHKQQPSKIFDGTRLSTYLQLSEYLDRDREKNIKIKKLLGQDVLKNKSKIASKSKEYLNKTISVNLALIYKNESINYQVDLKIDDYGIYKKE